MSWREAEPWDDDIDDDVDVADYDEDDEPTEPCPYCRREILEDAPRCPYCGQYIVDEDAPSRAKPWWFLIGVAATMYLIYQWTFG